LFKAEKFQPGASREWKELRLPTYYERLRGKEYLSQKGLAFQERDITQDPGALADLKKLGYMTTPVIVMDGAVIVGFDSAKIDEYGVG